MAPRFVFKRSPTVADAHAYAALSGAQRLEARVALASERRVNTGLVVTALALVVAVAGILPVVGWGQSLERLIFLTVFALLVVVAAGMAVMFAGLDPHRTRRAWREAFDYVDAQHPRLLVEAAPAPIHGVRAWLAACVRKRTAVAARR